MLTKSEVFSSNQLVADRVTASLTNSGLGTGSKASRNMSMLSPRVDRQLEKSWYQATQRGSVGRIVQSIEAEWLQHQAGKMISLHAVYPWLMH